MRRKGYQIQEKNISNIYSKYRNFSFGLAAAIVVSGGLTLHQTVVTAASSSNAQASQKLAQAPVTGRIIYVNPQGGEDKPGSGTAEAAAYKTISYALQQAQAGTVIQLAPGTYSKDSGEKFPLVLKSGVTLKGDEANKGQGIVINGGDFYVSRTFARQNITILAEKDSAITGITATNTNRSGTAVWAESTNPTITNSTFSGSSREGVFVTGTGNAKIQNNIFVDNKGNGVSIAKSAKSEIIQNIFQSTGFAIAVSDDATPLISGNQILQNNGGLVINGRSKPVLRNNLIESNRDHGVVVIQQALPDLGTQESPGKNIIRKNGTKDPKKFFDVINIAASAIPAIGNEIDQNRISGKVEFVAASVEPPPVDTTIPPRDTGKTAFKDIPGGFWAKGYIEALAAQKIITGFPDGSFKPDEPVTRAQFATIIAKAFSPESKRPQTEFPDVKKNFWGYDAIQSAYQGEFISGFPDKTFKPDQKIQRVQALVSLASGLRLKADNPNIVSLYSDASKIPQYAANGVAAATARKLVVNYPAVDLLNPGREATRAEVAAFVYQAMANAGKLPAIDSPYVVKGTN
jgi:parallel beta-helix repeat protein